MPYLVRFENPHLKKVNDYLALCLKVGLSGVWKKRESGICGKACLYTMYFIPYLDETSTP